MANFFINRPIFAIVLSIVITLLGTVGAFTLPIAQYPKISPPTISVSTTYQGANADVVDQTVAQVIEEQVNGVEDMVSMSSNSTDSGSYSLRIQFETDKNSDTAAKERPEIASISSNFKANTPGYQFEVDREKAEQLVFLEPSCSSMYVI